MVSARSKQLSACCETKGVTEQVYFALFSMKYGIIAFALCNLATPSESISLWMRMLRVSVMNCDSFAANCLLTTPAEVYLRHIPTFSEKLAL